ncbi:MAG: hypothetical protein ACRCXC_13255 [Legionella sp.]
METDKPWSKIQAEVEEDAGKDGEYVPKNPLSALRQQASANGLARLSSKIGKIFAISNELGDSDILPEPEAGKTALQSIGKYSAMFFANRDLSQRHREYCYAFYQRQKEAHDESLQDLYRPR